MTLSILSSNRVETLQRNLSNHISEHSLSHPFEAETIVVPTFAMARWLNLRVAEQLGIAANINYPLPFDWIWQLATLLIAEVPQKDPFAQEVLSWNIFDCLPGFLSSADFVLLNNYLNDDLCGIKRWQLAQRISHVFDRYQRYRPQLIRDWCTSRDSDWQAQLWRHLIRGHAQTHRVAVFGKLIALLNDNKEIQGLPERVSFFAVSSLPPLFIDIIQSLARHIEVRLYQHSPTDQYWADLKGQKAISRMRLANPLQASYFETGNELLASWGRQGQVLQDLLIEHDSPFVIELESCQAPGFSSLLHSVQQGIFDLDDNNSPMPADDSIAIHICHSPMRECQILHDQLLSFLDQDATLCPEHILVMVPEISRYAPYIESVFQPDENATRPNLGWNISDISLADEHPLVMIFMQLLKLPDSRFGFSELMSYLDIEEIRRRFQIDQQALTDIHELLSESQVRWGIDGKHKTAQGLPAIEENTWLQARRRIFAGYALGTSEFWNGIAPLHGVEGRRAESIGKFWLLFDRLQYWRMQFSNACTAIQWQERLNRLLSDFFVEQDLRVGHLQQIRDTIDNLKLARNNKISTRLLYHWMDQQLSTTELPGRLFSGGITFCGMRPMRCLPFKVICLLGMNDSAFPRRENHSEFDKLAQQWRPGDPSVADEDRYLMLETLLCARQKLYVSYSGRSLKDNSICQPSVLIRELLDVIDSRFSNGIDPANPTQAEKFSQLITTLHPMQAFSADNYLSKVASYDSYWCRIANKIRLLNPARALVRWPEINLEHALPPAMDISLNQLRRFISHPVQYFFNNRLNIWLSRDERRDDEEPFSLDALERWRIKQQITQAMLDNQVSQAQLIRAEGRLPHGHAGSDCLDQIELELKPLLTRLEDYRGLVSHAVAFDHVFDSGFRLSGQVGHYFPGKGLMHFTPAGLKAGYFISSWIDHLTLCASEQFTEHETSLLIWRDGRLEFRPVAAAEALAQLADYTEIFLEGQNSPLAVFPRASYAWAQQQDSEKALNDALKSWHGVDFLNIPGDRHDPYIDLAGRGLKREPLPDPSFETYATRIYALALANRVES